MDPFWKVWIVGEDHHMMERKRTIKDSEGNEVKAGSILRFSYGTPPVPVRATVIERDGSLIALTPSHNPKECPVRSLKRNAGYFYVEPRPLKRTTA